MAVSSDGHIKKYAIYGGTFDPIHLAHITLADTAVREAGLDELIFMPAYVSPFKQDRSVSSGLTRAEMISRVLPYNSAFRLSRYEICREEPSYTIETLRHFKSVLDGKLYFLMGLDSLAAVDTWHNGPELLAEFPILTECERPGTDSRLADEKLEEFRRKYNADITVLDMKPMDISATEIRNRAAQAMSLKDFVTPEVEDYIIEHKLYR